MLVRNHFFGIADAVSTNNFTSFENKRFHTILHTMRLHKITHEFTLGLMQADEGQQESKRP